MIYLVRHGQTVANVAGRHHGWTDSPLTRTGQEQARRAGMRLASLVDPANCIIFCSPLGRARTTALILADTAGICVPPTELDSLIEIGMGSAEGMTQRQMTARWPEIGSSASMSTVSPDGETLQAVAARLDGALHRIADDPRDSKVVVSHGIAIRVMQALLRGQPGEAATVNDAPQDVMFRVDPGGIVPVAY